MLLYNLLCVYVLFSLCVLHWFVMSAMVCHLFFRLPAAHSHPRSCVPPPPHTRTHTHKDTYVQAAVLLLFKAISDSATYESMSGYRWRGMDGVSALVIAVSGVCYFIKLSYWRDDWPGTSWIQSCSQVQDPAQSRPRQNRLRTQTVKNLSCVNILTFSFLQADLVHFWQWRTRDLSAIILGL